MCTRIRCVPVCLCVSVRRTACITVYYRCMNVSWCFGNVRARVCVCGCVGVCAYFRCMLVSKRVQLVLDTLNFIIWHVHKHKHKHATNTTTHRPKCVQISVGCAKRVVPHTTNLPTHKQHQQTPNRAHISTLAYTRTRWGFCMFNSQLNFFGVSFRFFSVFCQFIIVIVGFVSIILLFSSANFALLVFFFCLFTLFWNRARCREQKTHKTQSHSARWWWWW